MVDLIPHINAIVINHLASNSTRPFIPSYVYGKRIDWLADTGAGISCIDSKLLLGLNIDPSTVISANIEPVSASGHDLHVLNCTFLPIRINGHVYTFPVYVIENLASKAILGHDFLSRFAAVIDAAANSVQFPPPVDALNVFTTSECVIPPHALKQVSAKTSLSGLGFVSTDIFTIQEKLFYNDRPTFLVGVHNPTDQPLVFPKNFPFASFSPVSADDCHAVDEILPALPPSSPLSPEKRAYIEANLHTDLPDRNRVLSLLFKHHDAISSSKHDLGLATALPHKIALRDKEPVHQKQFRLPEEHLPFLHEYVENLHNSGCIQISNSPYNSAVFIVRKPHGTGFRMVQDFRTLNEKSYPAKYSIKEIQDCIDDIGRRQSTVFSKIDLTSGYWQMQLHPSSRPCTAFTIPGHARFEWCVVPQGIHSAPGGFQALVDQVLRDLEHSQGYLDDIFCSSKNPEDHFQHLEETLLRLRRYQLKLNLTKSSFFATTVDYLGHQISAQGCAPSLEKAKAMAEYPMPTTPKKIRQFTGLSNYFRPFIHNFAILAGHLTALLRKNSSWKSGPLPPTAAKAFLTIRQSLATKPVLAFPLPNTPYLLSVDAATGDDESPGGLGAVLTQIGPDGLERVVSYASRSLRDHEKNYSAFLLELTACVWAIDHFSVYLSGSRPFTLLSDHRPIEKLSKIHQKTFNRLQQQMLDYNFVVAYRKGSMNSVADALSRNTVDSISLKTSLSPLELFKLQQSDKEIAALWQFLRYKKLPVSPALQKFVKTFSPISRLDRNVVYVYTKVLSHFRFLVLAPKAMRFSLVTQAHAGRFSGHQGIFKTLSRILTHYFWPGMTSDVTKLISTCQVCVRVAKPHAATLRQPLTSLPVSSQPNFRVHLDLIGPLQSSTNNTWILAISDSFSKYIIAVPLPDKSAKTVAEAFFNHWILKFSPPKSVLTDRGKEFDCEIFRQLNTLLGTEVYKTASYHPATNSTIERWNRTFERIITSLLLQHQKSSIHWEQLLQIATYSYNISVHKSSQYSPFFLTYLHPPNEISFDVAADAPITSWPEDIFHSLSQIYEHVQQNLNASLPEPTGSFRNFNVGDRVLLSFPKQLTANKEKPKGNPKFSPTFHPNYTIVKKISPSAFHVKRPYGRPLVVNADRLKHDPSPAPTSSRRPVTRSMAKAVDHVHFESKRKPHYLYVDLDFEPDLHSPVSSNSSWSQHWGSPRQSPRPSPTHSPVPSRPTSPQAPPLPDPTKTATATGTRPKTVKKKQKAPAVPVTSPVRAALNRALARKRATTASSDSPSITDHFKARKPQTTSVPSKPVSEPASPNLARRRGRPPLTVPSPDQASSSLYPDLSRDIADATRPRGLTAAEHDDRPCAANKHAGLQDLISYSAPASPKAGQSSASSPFKVDAIDFSVQSLLPSATCTTFLTAPVKEYFLHPFQFEDTYQE